MAPVAESAPREIADAGCSVISAGRGAVESAGGTWVMLEQVRSADLQYDSEGRLTQGVTHLGSLKCMWVLVQNV